MSYSTRFDLAFGDLADLSQHLLLVQLSDDAIQLLATDQQRQPLMYQFVQIQADEADRGQVVADWLSQHAGWLQQWGRVFVAHQTMQATIVPAQLFNVDNGKELIDLQFGDLFRGTILTEQVPGRQDYTVYRIPSELFANISAAHPSIVHRHVFSLWISWLDKLPVDASGQVYLLFETNRVFMAIRREDWLLIQQYEFQAPEDISYYLLASLHEFELSPETVKVYVDGWIDTQSAVYQEMFKYIRFLETASLPEGIRLDERHLQGQPLHFFTPLIQMAQCVS
ncbi:DUF3822 family protein [Flavihumibacter fluvii]|uniref:DUF3822 family protein n=1 Tax=Flavihumibacter fluvii TaxID=2838157 RepID=UPI001BDF6745|nr:DUF3822 family protein [Flavihumibacter fluvii]ULQ54203.1 DUF3822 family protein [Flavihumibacter fluvii]